MKHAQTLLPVLLTRLGLPTMKASWEEAYIEASNKGWTIPQYLINLCELEIAERQRRKMKRHIHEAQLPKAKSLESFKFDGLSGITKDQIQGLANNNLWTKEGMNILIFGPSGVGKTHLAAAIGEKLVVNGFRVLFSRTTELVQKLQASKKALTLPSSLDKLDKYDCLILDDFGYVQKDEHETSVLFELICERYERKSMIITCNQPFREWDRIFIDKQMAIAAADRLIHHATILQIDAESYRKKEALARK
jgi:DNA replication protein DnaC